ncbi:MAG: hypothetical protein H7Y11_04385 [Armatimonadetes bacterium]|nr:hypothetical protein [Anaerolineae bacterium]
MIQRIALGWLLCVLLGGCASTPIMPVPTVTTEPFVPVSAWGDVLRVAQTEQANAPALWVNGRGLVFAWVGSDAIGVHHDVRVLTERGWSDIVTQPLNPIRPDAMQWTPGNNDGALLFYLDAHPSGETRLYVAQIAADLSLTLGPTLVSTLRTDRYAVLTQRDGSAWVVWSGGLLVERKLYAQQVDALGRPRQPVLLAADADYPLLLSDEQGDTWVLWRNAEVRQLYQARLVDGMLQTISVIADDVRLQPGERLVNISAGGDGTHTYVFWHIAQVDGTPQTWYTYGGLTEDSSLWQAARVLLWQDMPLTWVAPFQMPTERETLSAAAQWGDTLGIVTWQSGVVTGFEAVVTLNGRLIGLPALTTDAAGQRVLAWSQPTDSDSADLYITREG